MAICPQIPAALPSARRRADPRLAHLRCRSILAAVLTCLVGASLGWVAQADAATRHTRRHLAGGVAQRGHGHARRRATGKKAQVAPLVFGVYPGGSAGAVGSSGPLYPEDPGKRLSSLEQLRPAGKPFVLRLYAAYSGTSGPSAAAQVAQDIAPYTAAGFRVELVLCYRPSSEEAAVEVPGFLGFVRNTVDQLGSNRSLVSLQVTNEANVSGAPNAADGYYAGAKDALIRGVEAAKAQIERDGFGQLQVGFSWAYQLDSGENAFWSYLGQRGGAAFRRALDWVGIDSYPGTWGPVLPTNPDLASGVRQATADALNSLRNTYMPLAGIPRTVPIHVSESGYPTGPGRGTEQQSTVLKAGVRAVSDYRASYNVTDFRWFDLRDANSSSASFEDQYGLTSDTYVAKPAFSVYHMLVSRL
jgi:hypothetical protein